MASPSPESISIQKAGAQDACFLKAKAQNTCKRQVSPPMKRRVAAQQQYLCGKCNRLLDEHHEIDHKQPLWNGGTNDRSNLWALCSTCHKDKTAQENNWRFHFKLSQATQMLHEQQPCAGPAPIFVPPQWEVKPTVKDAAYYLPNYF